jgi:hypothetical protein
MTDVDSQSQQQPPAPDPALRQLDRFVGTWDMKGRTLGSDTDDVVGQTTFEWLPGGYFLTQRIKLNFSGYDVEGLEVIGYDSATGTFPSTVYPGMAGVPIPYRREIDGDELTSTTDVLGATFKGRWSEDGKTFSGGWRPNPGREGAQATSPTTSRAAGRKRRTVPATEQGAARTPALARRT